MATDVRQTSALLPPGVGRCFSSPVISGMWQKAISRYNEIWVVRRPRRVNCRHNHNNPRATQTRRPRENRKKQDIKIPVQPLPVQRQAVPYRLSLNMCVLQNMNPRQLMNCKCNKFPKKRVLSSWQWSRTVKEQRIMNLDSTFPTIKCKSGIAC